MNATDKTPAVLAIDAGGSKCEALLVAGDGTVLSHRRICDTDFGGRNQLVIKRTIHAALGRHAPRRLIVVGVGNPSKWRIDLARWRGKFTIRRTSEAKGALAAVGQTSGVIVIAGTGGLASVVTRAGREYSLDGLGPVLGDGGSGYFIGREAMRAVAHSLDLRQPVTRLHRRVLKACGCRYIWDLITFSLLPRDRSRMAALAQIVNEEAEAGDALARQLLRAGAHSMAGTVRDLVTQFDLANETYPLVGAGSVAMYSDIYWRELCRAVRQFAPKLQPVRLTAPPVAGLAAIGLRRLNRARSAAATERLFANLQREKFK